MVHLLLHSRSLLDVVGKLRGRHPVTDIKLLKNIITSTRASMSLGLTFSRISEILNEISPRYKKTPLVIKI